MAVVVFGENPYAEMYGDINKLDYASHKELKLLQKFRAQGIPVVSLFITGRPLWINPKLNASDAFVVIWHPGTEGAGVADVVMTDAKNKTRFDFTGKLSFSWPAAPNQTPLNIGQENYAPLFAYGYGLTYADKNSLSDNLSEVDESAKRSTDIVEVFKNRSIDPWQFTLTDDVNNSKPVAASVERLGALTYRVVDRLVQEDSIQLQWSGRSQASAGFISKERVDYSSLSDKAVLVFEVKVDKKPTVDVKLTLNCGSECGAEKSIADTLQTANLGEWKTIAISLNCFKKVKMDMLLSPFMLTTAGDLVSHFIMCVLSLQV